MFLKVLNKVYFRVGTQTKLLLIIELLPFSKLLQLLAINRSSSERRDIFVSQLLKLCHVLVVLQLNRCALSRGLVGKCNPI